MKKLILSSAVLLIFSFAILIFQASCKKEALAQSPVNNQNLILYTMGLKSFSQPELWIAKRDGSDKRQISLHIPSGSIFIGDAKIAPDGKILYVVSRPTSVGSVDEIWQISTAGTDPVKLLDNSTTPAKDISLLGVY